MIRVLQVTSTAHGIGGAEKLLLNMSPHYDSSQFEVMYCNMFDDQEGYGRFPTELKRRNLRYYALDGRRWRDLPTKISGLNDIINHHGIDIVHLHMSHANVIGGFIRLFRKGPPLVVTKHYTYSAIKSRFIKQLDNIFTNRAEGIVAVSGYVYEDVLARGADSCKTSVIMNGIDLDEFDKRHVLSQSSPKSTNQFTIGAVGNLSKAKGHEYLIRAMPGVLRCFPDTKLVLVGEGPERSRLQKITHALGLESVVSMCGFCEDIPAQLQNFDLFVHPSIHESFGLSLIEAMAARRAIVATNVEGIPEVVVDGHSGLLVPPCDPNRLGEAVSILIGRPNLRAQMGHAGRALVERKFGLVQAVRQYERVYLRVAQAGA